jgi:hypothetical protein
VADPPPIAVFAKTNARVTDAAQGGCIGGQILQSLEVGLVRPQIHINLSGKRMTAWLTRPPLAAVAFRVVEAPPGKAAMIVITTVSGVGKAFIGMGVIANPRLATVGLGQPIALAAPTPSPA